jgi:hypothetical protein
MGSKWLLMTPPSRIEHFHAQRESAYAPPPHMNGEERRLQTHCFGLSFTIMYLVLPQFGTGSV